jgi:hypothetical protein
MSANEAIEALGFERRCDDDDRDLQALRTWAKDCLLVPVQGADHRRSSPLRDARGGPAEVDFIAE